ncbi:MAG: tRNA (adenosine(37)-N6)-threonylcarbamoyltransferase complex dimerization subunit type 1 TsaB [Christensenellales bacterium]
MNLLCIETTGPVVGVALMHDNTLIYEAYLNSGKNHSLTLMGMVDCALDSVHLLPKQLDVVAAATGPGSFTGVRIGVSTARALAQGTGAKTVGVNALDALRYNVCVPFDVCAMMDARRQQVYTAFYSKSGVRSSDAALPLQEALSGLCEPTMFVGDGAAVYRQAIIDRMGGKALFAPPHLNFQRASSAAVVAYEKALRGETGAYMDLLPYYLRPSQAEREYEGRSSHE